MKYLILACVLAIAPLTYADEWPREIASTQGLITMYQPQIDSYAGNSMTARTALSITPEGQTEPMFGAIWFDCHVLTDRPSRTVKVQDLNVKQIKFPNRTKAETASISDAIEKEIPSWDLTFSLDELLESLETAQKEKENARDIDVASPTIIVMDHPAVLILIDGDPILTAIEGTHLRRVANTPYFIVEDGSSGTLYLRGGNVWYASRTIKGPWEPTSIPPQDVVTLSEQSKSDDTTDQEAAQAPSVSGSGKIPEIVVSTVPAELIASDGPLQFSPIAGTDLLYASNTPSKLFVEITSQQRYVLISGRWYTAKTLNGPWTYVSSDKLPADFAKIPPGSDRDEVLASVAGTIPAKEAILDAQIPQTAEVSRTEATSQVDYDGDPQFDPIENTGMEYAVNTSTPVILTGGRYYACDNGVWFEGATPRGPWGVCVAVPSVIYTIPPRCPVYYVRYVRVYSYTPNVVYVGYTSGYTGCYVYNHTVVYGTGYVYRPWYRHEYYPRPWTWGFGVHYDPWTGWSMGYSNGWSQPRGWFGYNSRVVRPGWWGPVGYRPAYHPLAGPVYRQGYHPVYRPLGVSRTASRTPSGVVRPAVYARPSTLYDRWSAGVRRPTETPQLRGNTRQPATSPRPVAQSPRPVARDNNVYATPEGNIVRQTPQGWQQRQQHTWKAAGQPPAQSGVQRDAQVRQRGAERTSSFKNPQPSPRPQNAAPRQNAQGRRSENNKRQR